MWRPLGRTSIGGGLQCNMSRFDKESLIAGIDVKFVAFFNATRDYTACSLLKMLHVPNTDVYDR